MKFWDRVTSAWTEFRATAKEAPAFFEQKLQKLADEAGQAVNPYVAHEESVAMYETMEDGMYALWPLANANERAVVYAARGVAWGALYTYTYDEDEQDQCGLAFEIARLVHEYMPEGTELDQMPGVKSQDDLLLEGATDETEYQVSNELAAFMDAAFRGDFFGASKVVKAVRNQYGPKATASGTYEGSEHAYKVMAINFLGSCLASLTSRYGELQIVDANGTE